MSTFAFTPEHDAAFEALLTRYPEKKALTLPALWMAQSQQGFLDEAALEYLSEKLELPYMHLYSVATFYTMFRFDPPKPVTVEVCRTLSCELCGKGELLEYLKTRCDDRVEIVEVECLGACGGAPAAAVNGHYHEKLTPEKLDAILKELGC